ncbi:MAG: hydantoinase/oxoprolinase N-terminal domain-containing protein, partial [Pseudomonadota bacterium]|nr:hydantoinase/oxoprolinase N-terminal domain-containing protein [Pseudomonadota bacterium]
MTKKSKWQFWIDRGGTFTDIVAQTPQGNLETLKLLSENPGQYQDAAIHGIQKFLGKETPANRDIESVKMGTTAATNALLEHRGEPTLLVITKGFRDALRIGYQDRPDIFALDIRLPRMLYTEVVEVKERISAHGEIIHSLEEEELQKSLISAQAHGIN